MICFPQPIAGFRIESMLDALIDVCVAALFILHEGRCRTVVHESSETLFTCAQSILGLCMLIDLVFKEVNRATKCGGAFLDSLLQLLPRVAKGIFHRRTF